MLGGEFGAVVAVEHVVIVAVEPQGVIALDGFEGGDVVNGAVILDAGVLYQMALTEAESRGWPRRLSRR